MIPELTHATARGALTIAMVEFPPSGGLFQFALQLGEGLARRGHRVELLTGPRPELASRAPGCTVRPILPTWHPFAGAGAGAGWHRARRVVRGLRHVAAWLRLIVELRRSRPDVVLWSAWRFPVDGWGVQVVRRLLPSSTLGIVAHEPRPLVEQARRDGLYKDDGLTVRALAGAYRAVDVHFVLGESAARTLREAWPITGPIHVIPHGDEGVFRAQERASAAVTPVEATGPQVMFFGTLTAYKGLDVLLAAWPRIRAELPEARLTVAGAPSADIDLDRLRAQVRTLDGVRLREGYVAVADVPELLGTARLVCLPYLRGSQSGVAHLAYTFGRPVIASRVGDIPQVVRDGESGLLVDPGEDRTLADAVIRLLRDPALAARLGATGRAALVSGASWDAVALAVESALPAPKPQVSSSRR